MMTPRSVLSIQANIDAAIAKMDEADAVTIPTAGIDVERVQAMTALTDLRVQSSIAHSLIAIAQLMQAAAK